LAILLLILDAVLDSRLKSGYKTIGL
jgi:hypothetical protein